MSQDINSVIIVGRICRDAELRYSANGTAICNFSIASSKRVKQGEQWVDKTSFFDLALFAKQAEGINKYLTKGQQVAVQGDLEQQQWESDGKKHSKVSTHVETIQLIGGKRDGATPQSQAPSSCPTQAPSGGAGGGDFDPSEYEGPPF